MAIVEKRVDRLEDLMAQLLETTAQTSLELREFKVEMRAASAAADARLDKHIASVDAHIAESKAASAAADARLDKHIASVEEHMAFVDAHIAESKAASAAADARLDAHIVEMREFQKNVRKDFGEVSNKQGRLVEDIVAPGIPKIFRDVTGLDPDDIQMQAVRYKVKKPKPREFDAVIISEQFVLINETKSVLRSIDVENFYQLMQNEIREYFPDYQHKKFLGVVSSLYVDDSIVAQGTKLGLFVLGFAEDLMDVLNPQGFEPEAF